MRLLLDFLCSVAQASGRTAKIDSVWKCSQHCFRHTHGVSFIKRSVDFFLKVYVGTKARFYLRTSFRIYKYAGTCAKNSFIDPSQGKIMHACISFEITICVRDSTRSVTGHIHSPEHLQPAIGTPSYTHFTQMLNVRSTVQLPELA